MFNDICNNILLPIFYYVDINYNLILKVIFINNVAIIFAKNV